ncbi:hypothetical protein RD110_05805 [Rhodoferax koreense]|uniref:GtrA/DPMS transmembrane domain-containing protein n=2 Tax=Rhodoferax koreensis TaxID=1842727 RepID=A0A1P8JSR3_9BURK|nr:hypothetical protein RD110_05805 [Rhodoferax koreense]
MDHEQASAATKHFSVRSAFSFLLVGGLATALQYLLTAIMALGFGVPPVRASAIAFSISAVANYLLNARFTFKSEKSHRETLPRFAITALAGLLVNTIALAFLLSIGLNVVISQILSTACVLLWNYGVNSVWTFRNKKARDLAP